MFDKHKNHDVFRRGLVDGAELVGRYQFPRILPCRAAPQNLLPFNRAMTEQKPSGKWVHFFIDDYQFERLWRAPNKYLETLKRFDGVISTDFSMHIDMPQAQQVWNCYRNRAIAYWLQRQGLQVVPTAGWSDWRSFDWCFDGLPQGGVVAVSTNGCLSNGASLRFFEQGYARMLAEVDPATVLVYGRAPAGFVCERAIFYKSYSQILKERLD